jgi:hypothetical protein
MSKVRERWLPAEWELADASAMQAIARGDADATQQKRALSVIVEKLAGTYEHLFVPGQPDTSTYLEGRASVGRQIVKLLKVDLAALRNASARQGKPMKEA